MRESGRSELTLGRCMGVSECIAKSVYIWQRLVCVACVMLVHTCLILFDIVCMSGGSVKLFFVPWA